MFYLQCMVGFRCGLPGGPAVSPVEKASKRGADCATTHFQPMVGDHAKAQIQKHDTVKISCVQVYFCKCSIDSDACFPPLGIYLMMWWFHLPVVDGHWSEWSFWEECTRSCGHGNQTRTRTCSNPSAQHGGRPCEGPAIEIIMCNIRPCPGENPPVPPAKLMYLISYPGVKSLSSFIVKRDYGF